MLDRYWAEISGHSKEDKWQQCQCKRSGRQRRACPGTGLRDCRKGRERIRRILRLLDRILAADPEQERCGRDRRLFSSCLVFPWFYFPLSSSSTMLSTSLYCSSPLSPRWVANPASRSLRFSHPPLPHNRVSAPPRGNRIPEWGVLMWHTVAGGAFCP